MDAGAPQRRQFLAAGWAGFPEGHEFDPEGELTWRDDANGLFFRVRPVPKAVAPEVPEQLRLWHWKAELNPWQKKHRKPGRGFLAFVSLERGRRSEEHTSELQSLMRISYAVFCLKKKTRNR